MYVDPETVILAELRTTFASEVSAAELQRVSAWIYSSCNSNSNSAF